MVDDHRQHYANLIAQWAEDQGIGVLISYEEISDNAYPNYLAYRLADAIVSNPYKKERDDA